MGKPVTPGVGSEVGDSVGERDGAFVVGFRVGNDVVGLLVVGLCVGLFVVGLCVGNDVVGALVVGLCVGYRVGDSVGYFVRAATVGRFVGLLVVGLIPSGYAQ